MLLLIVIEDKVARMLLKNQVKDIQGIDAILESNSAEDALFQLLQKKPQLMICSDMLPERNGFELANLLKNNDINLPVIILSNDSSRVIEAIRTGVSGFLVYPFSTPKLVEAVEKAMLESDDYNSGSIINPTQKSKIRIAKADGFSLMDIDLLTHCVADGAYTRLCFSNGVEEITSYYLGKVEKVLKDYKFVRINRSTLINMHKIREIDWKKGICKVDTGTYKDEFKITKICLKKLQESNLI